MIPYVNCYDDMELVRRFRFSRVSISKITELIANYLNFTERSYPASPHLLVCMALLFFASGTFQIICANGINISQASASRYIRDVSLGLQAIYHQFVSLPAGFKRVVKNKFMRLLTFQA
ncbi:Nuclease HARBI1 [Oopsacas minuta]|uniref:Nuclease HARBI1 n=1 Tax=Oopsacas minuta TaxID=111878 RepID=A0AAV7JJQ0_9METZ|nr:Nuclease HARBI1 [Oopsacas minuta]